MQSEYNANAHDLTKGDSLLAGFSRNSRLLFATGGLTLLFCTFCLILPLLYWSPAFDAAGIPREMMIAIGAGFGLCLLAVEIYRKPSLFNWHPVMLLMLLLTAWSCASLLWSLDRGSSLLGITQFVSLIVLALFATQLSCSAVQRYVLPATLVTVIFAALIGIGQHFGFNPLSFRQLVAPASTFVNKNYAANYMDLIMPVAFALLLIQTRRTSPLALLSTTAFTTSLGYLVISQTRGSWLGILVAVFSLGIICILRSDLRNLIFRAMRLHHRALILSLLVVIALAFTESQVIHDTDKLEAVLSLTPDTSTNLRFLLYQNSLVGFADHPWLGVGYGAFIAGFSPYIAAVSPIEIINQNNIMQFLHSDPLQMFFELGLVGGVLTLAIYLSVILLAWRIITSAANTSQRLIALGLMLALLASGAHSWVDFPLRLPTSAFFFWLWCGLVIGLYMTIHPRNTIKLSRVSLGAMGIVGLIFSFHAAHLYLGYLRANIDVRAAHFLALAHDCDGVYKLSNQAMNDFGIDHLTRFWYAKAYTYCDAPSNAKLRAMDRVLAVDPNMPLAHLTRARIQLKDGYIRGAASDFEQYRKLLPHRPEGYEGLASVALRIKNQEKARYYLDEALKRAPKNKELQDLLVRLSEDKIKEIVPKTD